MQFHRLHSVVAVDNGKTMESKADVLEKEKKWKNCPLFLNSIRVLAPDHNITFTFKSYSNLQASGPLCLIFAKVLSYLESECTSIPKSAQMPHMVDLSQNIYIYICILIINTFYHDGYVCPVLTETRRVTAAIVLYFNLLDG